MPTNFFIVGGMRTGSTYLSTLLDEHPQIEMIKPFSPEPKVFLADRRYTKADALQYNAQYFSSSTEFRGEKTVHYCELEHIPGTLSTLFADAKIIYILRHPIYRALSNYLYTRKNGKGIEALSAEDALSPAAENRCLDYDPSKFATCPLNYLKRSAYAEGIARFQAFFGRDRFKIVLYEEMVGGAETYAAVLKFLGADSGFVPQSFNRYINSGDKLSAARVRALLSKEKILELLGHFEPLNAQITALTGVNLGLWDSMNSDLQSC